MPDTNFVASRTATAKDSAPLVTICFPTTGRLEYLEQALASLSEQTYPNREVLILDNASPPEARAVLDRFAAVTPRTRVLRVEERVPMFANFNRGIREAQGKYLVYFHDDDVYRPDFLDLHVSVLEAQPKAGFAGGNFDLIDKHGELVRESRLVKQTETWPGRRFIEFLARTGRMPVSTPGLVFRRTLLERFDFDEQVPINWGDFTILMRMAETCDVALLREARYSWRVHGTNASALAFSRTIPIRTEVLRDYCAEWRSRHPEDPAFADKLDRYVKRGHRNWLLWGWFSAAEEEDAEACRKALQGTAAGAPLMAALRALRTLGWSARRRRAVLPFLRKMGEKLGA